MNGTKPVILLNIDSMMSDPLQMAIQTGKAPALNFLMENGKFIPELVSSFPTMPVTIDSSLLTGTYADQHGVPALNWFDIKSNQMINYGTGFRETIGIGFSHSVRNMFYRLNNVDLNLNVTTIFEELSKQGLMGAAINSFVYRGHKKHEMNVPKFIQAITNIDDRITTNTPDYFSLGAFSSLRKRSFAPFMIGGNYRFVGRELRYLIKENKLPTFTFCIFQDMDIRVHVKGPYDLRGIAKIDKEIQKILNLYDSWEEAIKKNVWLVIGDNGHSSTGWSFKEVEIDLRKILTDFRINNIKTPIQAQDQIVLSVNQRMAYVYVLDEQLPLSNIAKQLKRDDRIDVIAWKEGQQNIVVSGNKQGEFRFQPTGGYEDEYNQTWNIQGDLNILDINLENHYLSYNDFPDALARLHGALHSHNGRFLVVNAKPGHEFLAQKTPFHLGGACHGSLHKQESLIPFIITGVEELPQYNRLIDLKELILKLCTNKKE